jgi:amino acid transporter
MAVATSLNATLMVPARLALMLVADGFLPDPVGRVSQRTGTPVTGLMITTALALILVWSEQYLLALNTAVLALVGLYGLHTLALWFLPRNCPELWAQVRARVPLGLQRVAVVFGVVSMALLVIVQVVQDLRAIGATPFTARLTNGGLTSLELCAAWGALGIGFAMIARRRHEERGV